MNIHELPPREEKKTGTNVNVIFAYTLPFVAAISGVTVGHRIGEGTTDTKEFLFDVGCTIFSLCGSVVSTRRLRRWR